MSYYFFFFSFYGGGAGGGRYAATCEDAGPEPRGSSQLIVPVLLTSGS